MRITNIQRKELADIFRNCGLNLIDFDFSGQYKEFILKCKIDYFSFSINKRTEDEYVFNVLSITSTQPRSSVSSWVGVKNSFESWAKQVSAELNTPTGWEFFQNVNFLNEEFIELNKNFTDNEKVQIKQGVINLKEQVKTLELPLETLEIIRNKLDELSFKVDELNKFDWKSLLIGTILNLGISLVIPPEINGILWEYVKSAFSGLRLKG